MDQDIDAAPESAVDAPAEKRLRPPRWHMADLEKQSHKWEFLEAAQQSSGESSEGPLTKSEKRKFAKAKRYPPLEAKAVQKKGQSCKH